jgi:DDE domain
VKFPRATHLYLKIAGRMVYLWRAIDAEGEILDVLCENARSTDPVDKAAESVDFVAFTRDLVGVTLRAKRDPTRGVHFPAQSRAFAGRGWVTLGSVFTS